MRYAIVNDAQLAVFLARATQRASEFARRHIPGRRVRKRPPAEYSPGARGWSVPWAVYRDPRVSQADGGRYVVEIEDALFDDLPAPIAARFTATDSDKLSLFNLRVEDVDLDDAAPNRVRGGQ